MRGAPGTTRGRSDATRPFAVREAATVRSRRLSEGAAVRNRLFPKTRSWFSLDAPLELLSPLSVLRIVAVLAVVTWTLSLVILRPSGATLVVTALATASVLGLWLVLSRVPRLGNGRSGLVFAILGAQSLVVLVAGRGGALSVAIVLFLVLVGVAVGLFHSLSVVCRHVLTTAVVTLAVFWWADGAAVGLTVGLMTALACAGASITVFFVTRSASRQGAFDPDTGLPNGLGLSRRIDTVRQPSFVVAVVRLGGVDDARQALGYEVGTELLRRAVEDLGQVLPPATFIGRVDGDELVITAGLDQSAEGEAPTDRAAREGDALALARTLSGAITAGSYLVGDIEVALRCHVGLAIAPWDGSEVPELVRRASLSASQAAETGQAHLLWGGEFGRMTASDLAMLADLRLAAERGELFLTYQPQIAPISNRIVSVEALARWNSPRLGLVSPGQFVPLAERTGLVHRLTDWIIDEALDAQVRWRALGLDLPVAVNLSPTSLTTPDVPDRVLAALDARRLPPRCLTVEVTETAALDVLQAVTLLRPLHDRGVRISIDDFGTGYTSLAVLPDLPLDELKVDQRFVLRLQTSPADDAIVRTVRDLALRLGLDAVAEGVETGELYEHMQTYGFDLLQGYYFSHPLEEAALLEFVRDRDDVSDHAAHAVENDHAAQAMEVVTQT